MIQTKTITILVLTTIATVGAIGIETATQSAQAQPSGTGAAPINYQFGDVDAHGATIRAQAASHNPPTGLLPAGADEVL